MSSGNTKDKLIRMYRGQKGRIHSSGHLTRFCDESTSVPYFKTYVDRIEDASTRCVGYPGGVGKEVDLCI